MDSLIPRGPLYARRTLRARGSGYARDSRTTLRPLRPDVASRALYSGCALGASRASDASDARRPLSTLYSLITRGTLNSSGSLRPRGTSEPWTPL